MNRTGLADVAKKAGVSISTASRVLNRTNVIVPISEVTKARVQDAARELGYSPSAAARALRTGQTRTFGVLGNSPKSFWLWSEGDGFPSEMMRGMMQAALEHSFHMTLLTGETSSDRMPDLGMVDGILVMNRDMSESPEIADAMSGSGKPVVYLLDYPESRTCHAIAPDDVALGQMAARKLIEAGHDRIGFARVDNWNGVFGRREKGWMAEMEAVGLNPNPEWSINISSGDISQIKRQNLTAIVCANSRIARLIRDSAGHNALSLVAIVHSDGSGNPPADLAGVTFPLADMVYAGSDLLIRLIKGEICRPKIQFYEPGYRVGPTMP